MGPHPTPASLSICRRVKQAGTIRVPPPPPPQPPHQPPALCEAAVYMGRGGTNLRHVTLLSVTAQCLTTSYPTICAKIEPPFSLYGLLGPVLTAYSLSIYF